MRHTHKYAAPISATALYVRCSIFGCGQRAPLHRVDHAAYTRALDALHVANAPASCPCDRHALATIGA